MPDGDVQVKFGAELSGFSSGIDQVKNKLGELESPTQSLASTFNEAFSHVSEAIRAPLDALAMMKSSLRETAEIAGLAFAVDKVREWISEMGELGERTLNMAAAVGTTPHQFSLLSGALRLATGDAEISGRTLERIGKNIQTALTEPSSEAAKAARSLGITQAELQHASTDLGFALDLLADKFAAFADSPLKSADFLALTGRGMDQLVPVLSKGAAGFEALKKEAAEVGIVLTDQDAEALAETGEKLHLLGAVLEGEGVQGFLSIKGAIDTAIDGLTSFIEWTGDAIKAATNFSAVVANVRAQNLQAQHAGDQNLGDWLSGAFGAITPAPAGGIRGRNLRAQHAAASLPDVTVTAGAGSDQDFSGGAGKPSPAPWPTKDGSGGGGAGAKGQADELETWREQLQQKLEAEHNFFADSTKEELAYWQQKLALTKNGSKEQAEVESTIYGLQKRLAQEGLRDDEEAESRQESLDRNYLSAFERNMKLLVAEKKITLQQALGFDIQYTAQVEEEEKKRLEALIADDRLSQAEKEQYYDRLLSLENDYSSKIVGYQTEAMSNISSQWKDAVKQIDDQFASLATDVIMRTKSIQAAWDALLTDLVKDTLQSTIKGALGSLLGTGGSGTGGSGGGGGLDLSSLLLGSGGLGSLIFGKGGLTGALGLGSGGLLGLLGLGGGVGGGGLLGGLFGGGAGATDAWGGIGAASSGATGGGFLSGIGGLFSGLFGLLGFEHGGIVPSAAGGWQVPSLGPGGMLAKVHSQEMVLPAGISSGLQGLISNGGGHTFNIGVNAVDASSVAKLFSNNGSALVQALNNALRHGSALYQS